MNEAILGEALASLPMGGFRYFDSTGSTNDEALTWASQDAPDFSLVVSDEQTAGRGRSGRKWHTPPGSALAFSLIIRPHADELKYPARITGMGALAISETLRFHGLDPQIKWPNDVLVNGGKLAGILVESDWLGDVLRASVLGIGINVLDGSTPPEQATSYPSTCIETELRHPPDRIVLLRDVLAALVKWRAILGSDEFIQAWENHLAFRGQQVNVRRDGEAPLSGKWIGLRPNGNLKFQTRDGTVHELPFGEIHLRPTL